MPVVPIWNCLLLRMSLTNQSLDYSEKILPTRQPPNFSRKVRPRTFMVVSTFFTSPVISDSEKSIFEHHNCVRKAKRS